MKAKNHIIVFLIAILLVSCAPTATAIPTVTAIPTTLLISPPITPIVLPTPTDNEFDKHFVVYSASTDETSVNLYLVNTNSQDNKQITNVKYANYPSWSPDGKKIIFSSGGGLYIIGENGTGTTNIVDTPDFEIHPTWSPDMSKIAFISQNTKDTSLYNLMVVNIDGTNLITLSSNLGEIDYFSSFSWSPDGRKITFSQPLKKSREIVTVNTDGTRLTQVTNLLAPPYSPPIQPSWSPDGKKIAFVTWDLFIVNPDGTELKKLVDQKAEGFSVLGSPHWSPNGKYIACESGDNIILVNLVTKKIITISGEYPIGGYSWSPIGDKLAYFVYPGNGTLNIETINLNSMQKAQITKDLGFYPWQSLSWQP